MKQLFLFLFFLTMSAAGYAQSRTHITNDAKSKPGAEVIPHSTGIDVIINQPPAAPNYSGDSKVQMGKPGQKGSSSQPKMGKPGQEGRSSQPKMGKPEKR